jgi:hypothetical protein
MMLFSEFAGERTILTFQCTLILCFAFVVLVIGILILADHAKTLNDVSG